MGFNIFILSLLIFALCNLVFFIVKPLAYHLFLRTMRKALYTLFIVAVALGILMNEVAISNWQFLLTLTAIVIFMDLAILLTPSILKIWNAEFQYTDYVENIIKTNDKILRATINRVEVMSGMIQQADGYFNNHVFPLDQSPKERLELYLDAYGRVFGFHVQVWEVEPELVSHSMLEISNVESLSSEEIQRIEDYYSLQMGINQTLIEIAQLNAFDYGEEFEAHLDVLSQSTVISLIKEDSMIVPIFMDERQLLVVLKNKNGELLEVDAVHITNLIYLYYTLTF
ncbi:type II toxin-antitoxin system SpoIISA family toxin [Sutcliffiella sp. NPDC057660]|uniref:type II toxin-antitoxin system SpoIISA family toxin n=1 Tax=Sutcliffiella sp. NPDC057660 TaxID=3346199 RepID=UPI00368B6E66